MDRYDEIQSKLDIMSLEMDEPTFKVKPYSEVKDFIRKYLALSDEQNTIKRHGRSRRVKDNIIRNNLSMLDDLDKMRLSKPQKFARYTALMRQKIKEKMKWK
jgi:hypothetical protein